MCDDLYLQTSTILEAEIPGVRTYRTSMNDVVRRLGDWRTKTGIFYDLLDAVTPILVRASDRDGNLRATAERATRREIDQLVSRVFVGADGRNAFGEDGVTALSPFAQLLNEMYVRVVVEAVTAQRDWMIRNVPRDVLVWLARNGRDDLTDGTGAIREQLSEDEIEALRIFHPNPLAELDPNRQWVPMHKWNDPKGYRLSDRIWRTSTEVRREIDQLLAQGFRDGTGALELSRALEAYLIPGQEGVRTLRPYGERFQPGGASAWALRLARTEIARAANHAAFTASYLNPYVNQIDVARSSNGWRKFHNCTQLATISIDGSRNRPPYSIHSAMLPPYHPNCMCHVRPVLVDSPATVTNNLREMIQRGQRDLLPTVTPLQAQSLTQMLLHRALGSIVGQFRGQLALPIF